MGEQAPAFTLVRIPGATTGVAPELLEQQGGRRIGFEPAGMTVELFEEWQQAIAALSPAQRPQLAPAPQAFEQLRMVKEPAELDAIARAVALGDEAFAHAASVAAPGMTEKELAWEVQRYAMEHGAEELSFPTIIAGGPLGRAPARLPARRAAGGRSGGGDGPGREGGRLLLRPHAHDSPRRAQTRPAR